MQSIYIEILGPDKVGLLGTREGGFAEVVILANEDGTPSYAFKILKRDVQSTESVVTEVMALSRLPANPHVVAVNGYSASDLGYGILLPFYPANLRNAVQLSTKLRQKIVLAEQVLRGLQHIHANGVLHLDLKPDNILISAEGNAAISDFGISSLVEWPDLQSNPNLDVSLPKISGTLLYMAPEQLAGAAVSIKTDIFSFGILLYELVTGRLPWSADTVKDYARCILYARVRFTFKDRRRIPTWLRNIISSCLAKSPAARPTVEAILQGFASKGFHETVILADNNVEVREVNRAAVLAQAGKQGDAAKVLADVLKANPWNFTARVNQAELLFATGNVDDAIASARLSLQLVSWGESDTPSAEVLYLNLALYLMTKDPYEAYCVTSHALEKYPGNWELMHNHAEACRLVAIGCSGDGNDGVRKALEGLPFAERALDFRPQDVPLRVTYAGLLRLAGQRAKFIPYINQLLHDAGTYSVATRVLFVDSLIDEGELERAAAQIKELSAFNQFDGLLEGQKRRVAELRAGRR